MVSRALQDTGLPGDNLDLEVTEKHQYQGHPESDGSAWPVARTRLPYRHRRRHRAVSLDQHRRFPADRIKIDQTFVRNIGVDPADEAIVRATINMARNMNWIVVAEGVETEDHLRFLREYGCQELQGYLFARPLPAAKFRESAGERHDCWQKWRMNRNFPR